MKTTEIHIREVLQNDFGLLNQKLVECDQKIAEQNQTILKLNEQLDWFKRQIFGKRSERIVSDVNSQQLYFEGFEPLKVQRKEKKPIAAHERSPPNRNGKDRIQLDPDLPVEITILDIPEEEKVCKETGIHLVQIGTDVTHKLAHKPGSYFIKEIVRPKYAHPKNSEYGILTADLPDTLIPKCRADDSLLAEIITRKFVDHTPLYRIAEGMQREGVVISRQLLSQWVIRCGMALKPLYEEMTRKVLSGENIFIDETSVKLQEKGKCKTAFVWVVVGGASSAAPPYRIYDFREDRRHGHVLDIIKNYRGSLHSDKYGAYQRLAEQKTITWCPCWSHIRRKFFEAESGDPGFRDWVLRKIRYLFMLERVAWTRSEEERLRIRREKEAPIIDELIDKIKARLMDDKILPKSKFREALGYFCGLIPYLKSYLAHPFSRLDNNVAERAVRPLAIGRKNWLFFGSPDSGEAGTILLSFVQTCRGLGINPREYLEDVFRRLMSHSAQKLEELLPDQWLLKRQSRPPPDQSLHPV
jgi:transposase